MGELRQLNEQNKLAIWAERVTECRNSGQSVLAWCKEHGICSQTYYKWQKRLFSVGKTAIVNVDPPPSPLQRKQGRPEILLTGRPGVKFCVSDFRQSQEWRWKAGRILA